MSSIVAEAAHAARGRFIVLEGIDGSGTTTQASALARALVEAGNAVVCTHEPSAGPFGRKLRELLANGAEDPSRRWDSLALLFAADRLDHVAREIAPALAQNATVICDRYDLSSLAYQSATSEDPSAAIPWLRAINARAPRPDLTLVLDVEAEVAETRRARRGAPSEIFERRDLQRRLADVYRAAESLVPDDRLLHVAAFAPAPAVTLLLLEAIVRGLA